MIPAPPAEVWEWLVDRDKQRLWLKDEVEWLPADRSQLRAGYRGREVMQFPQGPSEALVEIVEFDPPRLMVARQEHEWFASRARFELRRAGEGTRVTSSVRIRYRKLTTWLGVLPILPFYGRHIRAGLVELERLVRSS